MQGRRAEQDGEQHEQSFQTYLQETTAEGRWQSKMMSTSSTVDDIQAYVTNNLAQTALQVKEQMSMTETLFEHAGSG
jgi:hypothetical protein